MLRTEILEIILSILLNKYVCVCVKTWTLVLYYVKKNISDYFAYDAQIALKFKFKVFRYF